MKSIIDRVVSVTRDRGLGVLLHKSKRKSKLYISDINGGYPVSIGENSVKIKLSNYKEVNVLEYILDEEEKIIRDILDELESEDIIWDIGANMGVHTCFFGQKANKVISIEPYPPNIERLRENININEVDADVLPVALSDRDGTEDMSVPETELSGDQWPALLPDSVTKERRKKLRNSETSEVKTKRGDTLVDEIGSVPNIVKIDVEGASNKVINGMKKALKHPECRIVYVEVHLPMPDNSRPSIDDFDKDVENIKNDLEEIGFDVRIFHHRENDVFLKCNKN